MPNRTCVVLFGKNQKKAEKKLKKLKETYTIKAKGGYDVRYLTKADFKFAPVYMGIEDEQPAEKPKKEKKEDNINPVEITEDVIEKLKKHFEK